MSDIKKSFLELLEKDTEFRYAIAGYLGYLEILERLNKIEEEQKALREEQTKVWREIQALREESVKIWREIEALRINHGRRLSRLEESLGALVEAYLLDRFISQLRERGLNVKEMRGIVIDGMEIDAILRDDEVIVIEVSTTIRKSQVQELLHKLEVASKIFARKVRAIMLGVKVDSDALRMAREKGIDVLSIIGGF
ncbi:MAG: hypothetical protein ACXQTI_10385 [Candidatus Nezhaarchaeales archaeon]